MAGKNGGCAFGKVSRNMIENQVKEFDEFKGYICKEFSDLKETNTTLYNHLSERVPPWVTIVMAVGASLLTGVIVWGLGI